MNVSELVGILDDLLADLLSILESIIYRCLKVLKTGYEKRQSVYDYARACEMSTSGTRIASISEGG